METLEQTIKHTHDWTLKRVEFLSKKNKHDDAYCCLLYTSDAADE